MSNFADAVDLSLLRRENDDRRAVQGEYHVNYYDSKCAHDPHYAQL